MKKVRFAVVGSGWISQIGFLPGVAQTGNAEIVALVSGNRGNAGRLADFHGIPQIFSYDQYDDMLKSGAVDAVYIALPNSMHADYAIRAARAGVHALVEKPLATSVADGEAMIAAADKAGVWLMTAYRLHTEPGTLALLDMVRQGEIGDPRYITSAFSFQAAPSNHRLDPAHWGGPLQDVGVYCINAARHVFGEEPLEAVAMRSEDSNDPRFAGIEECISASLRFPGGRMAQFMASFGGDDLDMYRVVGTRGDIELSPGFRLDQAMVLRLTRGGKVTETRFPQVDHFSGMTAYFADCIQKGIRPEPDGGDGLNDVRALLAIEAAARTGQPQKIDAAPRPGHPAPSMARQFPPTSKRLML